MTLNLFIPQPGVERLSPLYKPEIKEPDPFVFTFSADARGATMKAKRKCWFCGDVLTDKDPGHSHEHDCLRWDGILRSTAQTYAGWE